MMTMYAKFLATYDPAGANASSRGPWEEPFLLRNSGYRELAQSFAGVTFNEGLYRIHDASSGPAAQQLIADNFPRFAPQVRAFGFDWTGNQYALDNSRKVGANAQVKMFEISSGSVFDIPATLVEFHNDLLPSDKNVPLGNDFFQQWRQHAGMKSALNFSQCVGHDIPLVLGGSDTIENLSATDLEVYWSLTGQLRAKTADLPLGTKITGIDIS
jgi:Domain of unknown function (DUF1851)